MMEVFMVCGVNWSGWLRVYSGACTYPLVLEVRQQNNKPTFSEHKFIRECDLDQFIDELDFFEGGEDVSY